MKVLMTVDAVGGVWTYALELMRALEQDGVTFGLATMGSALTRGQREDVQQLRNVELFESTFLLEWMPEPWAEVERAGEWLLDLEGKVNPDVVHLNGFAHGALPWRTRPLVVAHSCVISWWQAVKRQPVPAWLGEYRRRVLAGLWGAGMVAAPTRAMLDSLRANYSGLPRARVIANGRSSALYQPGRKQPAIVSVGRIWDEGKNVHALTRIADRVEWPIYIAGDPGPRRPPTPAPKSNVHVLGVLPAHDIGALLSRASIYALPALYEPFGLSVLEAAHAGCALVLGDIPSLRENWHGAARFVEPRNDEEIRRALRELIGDEAARADLGRRARERASRFMPEKMAATYLNTYIELSLERTLRGETCAS